MYPTIPKNHIRREHSVSPQIATALPVADFQTCTPVAVRKGQHKPASRPNLLVLMSRFIKWAFFYGWQSKYSETRNKPHINEASRATDSTTSTSINIWAPHSFALAVTMIKLFCGDIKILL
jgi:hypothetical protein